MGIDRLWLLLEKFDDWLGVHPSSQDLVKAGMLIAFALAILMILGDVYRGEIQNTFHRIRLIPHPNARDPSYAQAMQVPHAVVPRTLDRVFSNVLFYYRYRDHRGRLRTRRLHTYRVRFKARAKFQENTAPGQETRHHYVDEEQPRLGRELPDIDTGRNSEIVSIAASRCDHINELAANRMVRADDLWSKLSRSRLRRFFHGVREEDLKEPELIGLVVKFHFPIDPYFLLYRHPDTNVRSTAWLTVMTSIFAVFMQLVFATSPQSELKDSRRQAQAAVFIEGRPAVYAPATEAVTIQPMLGATQTAHVAP